MRAGQIGVVKDVNIALLEIGRADMINHHLDHLAQRTEKEGQTRSLSQELSLFIEQGHTAIFHR